MYKMEYNLYQGNLGGYLTMKDDVQFCVFHSECGW